MDGISSAVIAFLLVRFSNILVWFSDHVGWVIVAIFAMLAVRHFQTLNKDPLTSKVWYRSLRVLFYVFGTLAMLAAFFFASMVAEEQTQVLNEQKTYEAIGAKVRSSHIEWDEWKYPWTDLSSNSEIGRAFYENRYTDPQFARIWTNKTGVYEYYDWQKVHSFIERVRLYFQYLVITFLFLILLRTVGMYIIKGRKV